MSRFPIHRARAFTLVELLAVVSILALLIAMLFPSLRRARTQGKRTACASNLRQIGVALQGYLGENNDRFPFASFMPSTGPSPLDTDDPIFIADVLDPYRSNRGKAGQNDDDEPQRGEGPSIFRCPGDRPTGTRPSPNTGLTYYESERSSYEYRTFIRPWLSLAGQTIAEVTSRMEERRDDPIPDNSVWVMRDYYNFHGKAGENGARRYLYIDGHVSDFGN